MPLLWPPQELLRQANKVFSDSWELRELANRDIKVIFFLIVFEMFPFIFKRDHSLTFLAQERPWVYA
jgi:hypothetical protein